VRTGHQLAEAYRLDTVQANISNRFRRTEKHLEWGLKANILLQRIVPYKKWEKLENDRKTVHIIRIGVSNLILKAKEPGLS
jgi:hypothetical protein